MTRTDPNVTDVPDANRYELHLGDGELPGFAEYRRRKEGETAFVHTQIEPEYGGRGLGSVLIRGALDAERAAGRAVLPYCPFVRGYIEKHPEYADLVPAGFDPDSGRPS